MLSIREMTEADIPLGLSLCRIAGWNQLEADWRRLISLSPGGVFVASLNGKPCGTASTMRYGDDLAWIGMILVHPEARGQGIGSALMRHCIDFLHGRGTRTIKLDATDAGLPVYAKLGFKDECEICRYVGTVPAAPAVTAPNVHPIGESDWPAIGAMDALAFGANRLGLLRKLATEGPAMIVKEAGQLRGFGLARPGYLAWQLGPVVASDAAAAEPLVRSLLARIPPGQVSWDLLPDVTMAADLAQGLGFNIARRLTRMYLGEYKCPRRPGDIVAAAGFEMG